MGRAARSADVDPGCARSLQRATRGHRGRHLHDSRHSYGWFSLHDNSKIHSFGSASNLIIAGTRRHFCLSEVVVVVVGCGGGGGGDR